MKYKVWKNETTNACYIAVPGSDDRRPELIVTDYGRFIPLDEAEAEVIVTMLNNQVDQIIRLKAEVERLTSDIQMEKENEDRLVREWQKANNEVYGLKTQVAALIDELERLRKGVQS